MCLLYVRIFRMRYEPVWEFGFGILRFIAIRALFAHKCFHFSDREARDFMHVPYSPHPYLLTLWLCCVRWWRWQQWHERLMFFSWISNKLSVFSKLSKSFGLHRTDGRTDGHADGPSVFPIASLPAFNEFWKFVRSELANESTKFVSESTVHHDRIIIQKKNTQFGRWIWNLSFSRYLWALAVCLGCLMCCDKTNIVSMNFTCLAPAPPLTLCLYTGEHSSNVCCNSNGVQNICVDSVVLHLPFSLVTHSYQRLELSRQANKMQTSSW